MANRAERAGRVPCCRACGLPSADGRRLIAGPGVHLCEACLARPAQQASAAGPADRCAFCRRRDVPIAGAWPSLIICASCAELARAALAEDSQRSGAST